MPAKGKKMGLKKGPGDMKKLPTRKPREGDEGYGGYTGKIKKKK